MRRFKAGFGAIFAAAAALMSPAGWAATTAVYIDSPAGEYIGQGQEQTFTSPDTTISVWTINGHGLVSVAFDGWYAQFERPAAQSGALAPGNYENAIRYGFNSGPYPGLSLTAPGRSCNRLEGWFEVHEVSFSEYSVLALAIDFVQSCDGGPMLFGAIRVNSDIPLTRPEPNARVQPLQVVTEGETVSLAGLASFDHGGSIAAYQWTQQSGTPVTLVNADAALATFSAPDVAPGGETLVFTLMITDADGNADWQDVEVTVHDAADLRTRAFFDSDPGDLVGQGLTYWYDEATASIGTYYDGSAVRLEIDGLEQWYANFARPLNAPWAPGMYAGVQRYPYQASSQPGLAFFSAGLGCDTVSGWFEIVEIQIVGSTVLRLAVDFVQHCGNSAPALFGAIRINSSVPLDRQVPYAVVLPTPPATEGAEVVLDGSDSSSRDGSASYLWTQTGGTPVALQNPDAAVATFVAPDVAPGGETLIFLLTVTDGAGNSDSHEVSVHIQDSSDPRTQIYLDSPPGDPIGSGVVQTFAAPASPIGGSVTDNRGLITVLFDGWRAEFEAPSGRTLVPGNFEQAARYPINSAVTPGLSVASPGRGCSQVEGWFEIQEATYSGSTVVKFAADFLQSCDGAPPLFGAVRINSAIPVQRPQPYARASGPGVVTEGEPVILDGSRSFDRDDALASFQWMQVEGTPVSLTDANTAELTFTAPQVPAGGALLRFTLTVTDVAGNSDVETVGVTVHDTFDARNAMFLKSDAGDWVGAGLTYEYGEGTAAFTTNLGRELTVGVNGSEEWRAAFRLPPGGTWQPGTVVVPYDPFYNALTHSGIDFSGEARGCGVTAGWFEILEVQIVGSSVLKLAVDFVQHCEKGAPALFGAIRINSSVPLRRGVPYAIASSDALVQEGQPIELDGNLSYASSGGPLTYQWTQTSGPPVEFSARNSPLTTVDYGPVLPAGADYAFRLQVTDSLGLTDAHDTQVHVLSRSEPQTYLVVDNDPDTYVGEGRDYFFLSGTSQFYVERNFDNGISVDIYHEYNWSVDFAGPDEAPLQPGPYEDAQRFPFQAAGRPGVNYSGKGAGCNTVTGRFDVFRAVYRSDGSVETAAIDFEHHCDGTLPASRGKLRINFAPDNEPVASAGPDRDVDELEQVTLDGTGSRDRQGAISYEWRQLSGPAVVLTGANTSSAHFTAPPVEEGVAEVYAFALRVTDLDGFRAEDAVTIRVLAIFDTDGDGVTDGHDAFPLDPTEWADTDGDGTGNNADAFPDDPAESSDADEDGVGDNADAFPDDPVESTDTDGDSTGNNADADDDNDGKPDSTESLAPNGDGNADGIPDSLQANVASFVDNSGAAVTVAVAGGTLQAARAFGAPSADGVPPGVTFDRGFFGIDIGVPPGGAALATIRLHTGAPPVAYYKYGQVGGGANGYYEFTYNGTTGAELLPGVVVLHLVDGARGDADGVEDGLITDPGAPAWQIRSGGGGGGGSPSGGLLVMFAALTALRRRLRIQGSST